MGIRNWGIRMRYNSLDGLRGLAAFSVVMHHWLYCFTSFWKTPAQLIATGNMGAATLLLPPIFPFVNGGGAVLIFFVLSGFVLTLGLSRAPAISYRKYIANRFVRIYPAFVAGISLAVVGVTIVGYEPIHGLSEWFNQNWARPVSATLVAGHLAMVGGGDWVTLNNVIWSLIVEMRVAVVMPLIYLAVKRTPVVTLVVAAMLSFIAHLGMRMVEGPLITWFDTLRYIVLFAAGSAMAIHREWIERRFQNLQIWQLGAMLAAVLVFYGYPFGRGLRLYATAPAAVLITMAAFASPLLRRILELPPFQYLGRVSYSLYLVHLPVILIVMHTWYGKLPTTFLFFASITMSFVMAELLYRLVERPSHLIARAISRTSEVRIAKVPAA
jgi:peptidoglycan/LPS O-acetylase OafA/YrhL